MWVLSGKTIMGAFSWLKKALEQHQESGCETTPEAESFVDEYSKQIEAAKRSLRERQKREQEEQSSKGDR
jgi:hypothetical protein